VVTELLNEKGKLKSVFAVGKNMVVIIDKKIVKKFGIRAGNTFQEELTKDGILLKPKSGKSYDCNILEKTPCSPTLCDVCDQDNNIKPVIPLH
jgi:hypothetical protein